MTNRTTKRRSTQFYRFHGQWLLILAATSATMPFPTSTRLPVFGLECKPSRGSGESSVTPVKSYPVSSLRKAAAFALMCCDLIVLQTPRLAAQSGMNCHATNAHATETREAVAPEKLPPPQKLTGIGNAHLRITASPEAQMWFDQGLNLLHDFWDYESARAFEQSIRVDPQCAMCYWGIYRANKSNYRIETGYFQEQALAKAVSLKNHAGKAERLYIEASAAAEAAEKSGQKENRTGANFSCQCAFARGQQRRSRDFRKHPQGRPRQLCRESLLDSRN